MRCELVAGGSVILQDTSNGEVARTEIFIFIFFEATRTEI